MAPSPKKDEIDATAVNTAAVRQAEIAQNRATFQCFSSGSNHLICSVLRGFFVAKFFFGYTFTYFPFFRTQFFMVSY